MRFLQSILISACALQSALAVPMKGNKKDLVFKVPSFDSSIITGRMPPPGYIPRKFFNFTVTDVFDKTYAKIKPFDTYCYAEFEVAPSASNRSVCNDSEFTWYFAEYDGIANFTLNVQHTYKEPA
ncbi:MAG: hypothetical protein M1814_004435 [Vezdaea aestivalis]|nr:MAG: hypothetical protein M1814_004435 [Vezdaea aestivalis]